jgi:hypothetical protein
VSFPVTPRSITVRRFGNWILNLTPPEQPPTAWLDLEPRVLFAPGVSA